MTRDQLAELRQELLDFCYAALADIPDDYWRQAYFDCLLKMNELHLYILGLDAISSL